VVGQGIVTLISVTNLSGLATGSVQLTMRLPDYMDPFDESLADGAQCNTGPISNALCERAEEIAWTLGSLDPGEVVEVSISPIVSSTGSVIEVGEIIEFRALARDSSSNSLEASIKVAVPEPGIAVGLALGAVCMLAVARRRNG
jgi:hypothetical protein